jgi:hypothetical protein
MTRKRRFQTFPPSPCNGENPVECHTSLAIIPLEDCNICGVTAPYKEKLDYHHHPVEMKWRSQEGNGRLLFTLSERRPKR